MAYAPEDSISIESLVGPMMLDVPIPIAVQAVAFAAIEFCERTLCWSNALSRSVSTRSMALTPEDDGLIMDVSGVTWDGMPLTPLTREQADHIRVHEPTGIPQGYYRPGPDTLTVSPDPVSPGVLSVTLLLAPVRTATTLPRMLYDLYWDAIESGAKFRLLSQAHRPWGDPGSALFYKQQFEMLVGSFSACAGKDGTRKPLRTAPSF